MILPTGKSSKMTSRPACDSFICFFKHSFIVLASFIFQLGLDVKEVVVRMTV